MQVSQQSSIVAMSAPRRSIRVMAAYGNVSNQPSIRSINRAKKETRAAPKENQVIYCKTCGKETKNGAICPCDECIVCGDTMKECICPLCDCCGEKTHRTRVCPHANSLRDCLDFDPYGSE
jgi:hypothetical protein